MDCEPRLRLPQGCPCLVPCSLGRGSALQQVDVDASKAHVSRSQDKYLNFHKGRMFLLKERATGKRKVVALSDVVVRKGDALPPESVADIETTVLGLLCDGSIVGADGGLAESAVERSGKGNVPIASALHGCRPRKQFVRLYKFPKEAASPALIDVLNKMGRLSYREAQLFSRGSNVQLPTSSFRGPTSKIQDPMSNFQGPASNTQLSRSNFQDPTSKIHFQYPTTKLQLPITNFQGPASNIQFRRSKFQYPTSKIHSRFQLPSSKFQVPRSNCQDPTSNAQLQRIQLPISSLQYPACKIQLPRSNFQYPTSKVHFARLMLRLWSDLRRCDLALGLHAGGTSSSSTRAEQ